MVLMLIFITSGNSQIREKSKRFSKKFETVISSNDIQINTITILTDDKFGLREEIYFALTSSGIKSLSVAIAKEKLTNISVSEKNIAALETTDFKADVGLEFSTSGYGLGLTRFTGTLINLNNGENIGIIRWSNLGSDRSVRLVGEAVAYILMQKFIELND